MVKKPLRLYNWKRFIKQEGVYSSFWLGRFSNMFIKKGKKKKIMNYIYRALLTVRALTDKLPILYILELAESLKPTFKLENCFPGKVMIVYPKYVSSSKRYIISFRWIYAYILTEYRNSRRLNVPLYAIICNSWMKLSSNKHNQLIKKRDRYHEEAINLQDNIRYSWKRP